MSFFDVSVCAVPNDKPDAYLAHCKGFADIARREGALAVTDTWGADVPDGKVTDFKRSVQATADETVCVGWIVWPDKAARDAAWEKLMADPEMQNMAMPFDGKRMIFGGFDGINEV